VDSVDGWFPLGVGFSGHDVNLGTIRPKELVVCQDFWTTNQPLLADLKAAAPVCESWEAIPKVLNGQLGYTMLHPKHERFY
jgi:hypothetical protein